MEARLTAIAVEAEVLRRVLGRLCSAAACLAEGVFTDIGFS